MKSSEELITDADLEKSFAHANFGDATKRDVLRFALLKYACGYSTGHTAKCILGELGLLSTKQALTKKGKEYLFLAFYQGNSY